MTAKSHFPNELDRDFYGTHWISLKFSVHEWVADSLGPQNRRSKEANQFQRNCSHNTMSKSNEVVQSRIPDNEIE